MLKQTALLILIIILLFDTSRIICADAPSIGLLFDSTDLSRIKENLESEYLSEWWQNQQNPDRMAEQSWFDSLVPGQDCKGIVRVENILRREAFVYAVTGNSESADHARLALLKLVEYPRWDVFYDGNGKTLGVDFGTHAAMSAAYALDWLGDVLDTSERSALVSALAEKGCEACYHTLSDLRYPEGKTDWRADHFDLDLSRWPFILDETNIKGLMIGGLGIGALALLDEDPRAVRWLEMAEYSCREFLKLYRPDGFYPEGSGYWEYSSRSVFPFVKALKRKTGSDLSSAANLRGSAESWLEMQMPVDYRRRTNVVNFGDNGREITSSPALWVASTFRDGLAQWSALNFSRHHDIHSPIFMDQSVIPEKPTSSNNYSMLGYREWLIARTGFKPRDIVLAMRSGGPVNHEHGDRNSLILKAFGQVLLNDIPHPSYSRHDPSWILRGSAGHNCVLIDGLGVLYHNGEEGTNASLDSAKVIQEGRRPGYFFWTSDATPAYRRANPDVKSVVRTVIAAFEVPVVVVIDKVSKLRYPSIISALWHADNEDGEGRLETDGRTGFTIYRPGTLMAAMCAGSQSFSAEERCHTIKGKEKEFPYIEILSERASLEHLLITVLAPCPENRTRPELDISKISSESWNVRVQSSGKDIEIRVTDNGKVPLFEIVSAP